MTVSIILIMWLVGMVLNLSFSGVLVQPDWGLAVLLAALLAHRGNWVWVIPAVWVHDLVFHWTSFVCLPWMILAPVLVAWSDAQIGPSLWQRMMAMLVVVAPLLSWGWSMAATILTLLVCLSMWSMMAKLYAEPI